MPLKSFYQYKIKILHKKTLYLISREVLFSVFFRDTLKNGVFNNHVVLGF